MLSDLQELTFAPTGQEAKSEIDAAGVRIPMLCQICTFNFFSESTSLYFKALRHLDTNFRFANLGKVGEVLVTSSLWPPASNL